MEQARPSRTGELTGIMRAIHQTADEEPKILADSIAPRLVDTTGADDEWLTPILGHPFAKQWRAGFLIAGARTARRAGPLETARDARSRA